MTQNGCIMYSPLHLFAHPQRSHSDLFELRSLIVRFRKYIILCSDPFTSTSPQSAFQVPNKQINIFQEEKILKPNLRETHCVSGRQSRVFHQHSNHTVNHKQPNVFRNVARSKGHVSSVLSNVLQTSRSTETNKSKKALILSHHSGTLSLHLNTPLGRGRKGLHLFS